MPIPMLYSSLPKGTNWKRGEDAIQQQKLLVLIKEYFNLHVGYKADTSSSLSLSMCRIDLLQHKHKTCNCCKRESSECNAMQRKPIISKCNCCLWKVNSGVLFYAYAVGYAYVIDRDGIYIMGSGWYVVIQVCLVCVVFCFEELTGSEFDP